MIVVTHELLSMVALTIAHTIMNTAGTTEK